MGSSKYISDLYRRVVITHACIVTAVKWPKAIDMVTHTDESLLILPHTTQT